MKIPSTKRVCLVGSQQGKVDLEMLKTLVNCDRQSFVPRQKLEKVRNCTKVDKSLTEDIVRKVVKWCLCEENFADINNKKWNMGCSLKLGEIVEKLQNEQIDLSQLKQECGGLQTLFRNHHYIFVVEKGTVRLRIPGQDVRKNAKSTSKDRLKTKPCWHYNNHPDGCPLLSKSCQWIH